MISDANGAAIRAPRLIDSFPDIPLEVFRNMERRARRDPATLEAVAREWPTYLSALEALIDEDDGDGVPVDLFVDVYQRIMRLSAFGVRFDEIFLAWFDEMQQQVRLTDEGGGDYDPSDVIPEVDDAECEKDDAEHERDDSEYEHLDRMSGGWTVEDFPNRTAAENPLQRFQRLHDEKAAKLTAALKANKLDRPMLVDIGGSNDARHTARNKRMEIERRDKRRDAELYIALAQTVELDDSADNPDADLSIADDEQEPIDPLEDMEDDGLSGGDTSPDEPRSIASDEIGHRIELAKIDAAWKRHFG